MWVQPLGLEDPRKRAWQPTPVFFPEDFHEHRSLSTVHMVDYGSCGPKELTAGPYGPDHGLRSIGLQRVGHD